MKQGIIKSIICLGLFLPLIFMYPWIPNSGWPDQAIVFLFATYTWSYIMKPRSEIITCVEVTMWVIMSGLQISRIVIFGDTPLIKYYPFIYIVLNLIILISYYVHALVIRYHRK